MSLTRSSVVLVVVLGFSRAAFAGQPIEGRVIDGGTGLPVAGATVHVQGTKLKAKTGAEGQFSFANQPEGTYVLEVSKPPYISTSDSVVVTADAPPAPAELLLIAEDAVESVKVEEVHKRESPAPGATELVREEIQKIPGSRGDFMSTLQSLPGIANTGTFTPFSSGLIIRGSDPSDARILVDGFEIPILYHFGAVQAILPSEMIGELVYAPGGFGVEHGRASAGIVDVRSRSGQPKLGGFAELSFVNGAMFLQGPIGKNATFAVSMRRSVVDAVLPAVLPKSADLSFSVLPRYYDWQARIDWKPSDSWKLALFYFGSDDNTKLSLGPVDPSDPGLSGDLSNRTHFDRLIASATYTGSHGFTNRIAASADITKFGFEMSFDRHLRLNNRGLTVRDEATWELGKRLTLHGGAEGMGQFIGFDRNMPPSQREGDPNAMNFATDPTIAKKADFTLPTVAAWASADVQLTEALSMTGGLRYDGFIRNGSHLVQPRVEVKLALGKNTFRASNGLYSRPPYWEDEVVQTNIGPEKSWQSALGWERELLPRLTLQTTAFYTQRWDLLMYDSNPRSSGQTNYINQGRGKTYGAELLLTWRGAHHFAWVAYTLSRSTRQDTPNSAERLFDFDQTHNLVLVGSRSFGKNDQWQLGGRFQFTTGKPYTPVVGTVFMADLQRYQPIYAPTNSSRMAPMHQLDLRLDHWWKFQHWKLSTYLDVQNVYYHASTMDYRYNQDYSKKTAVRTLPILPSFGVRGEF